MLVKILTIGDEILIGQIVDTNSAWMAKKVLEAGGQVVGKNTVGDDHDAILNAISTGLDDVDVLLVTGGLGPTRDDITKKSLADYYGVGFVFSQETHMHIAKMFERFGRPMMDSHREQCFMPQNAELLMNKMGSAPGMWFQENGKVVVSMPGVPYEMKYLMEYEVLPKLNETFHPKPVSYRTILTAGKGESQIAEALETFEDTLPDSLKLAYLPNLGAVRVRLTAISGDTAEQKALLESKGEELKNLLGTSVFGEGITKLEESLGNLLNERNLKLGTAESCTGGYIAHRITSIPGSSSYYQGSFVTYSNTQKEKLIQVKPETLKRVGAVSEEVVLEMLVGMLENLGVDVGITVSGIMGPGGAVPGKPVGTVWIAYGDKTNPQTMRLSLGKDRLKNIEYTAVKAINALRLFILESL